MQKAGLLKTTPDKVTLQFENGETKEFSQTTFKRWWKELVDENFVVAGSEVDREQKQNVPEEETPEPESKNTEVPEQKKRGREKIAGSCDLEKIIEEYAVSKYGATVFSGKVVGFRSLKTDGRMFMAYNFNTKGVTLHLRSAAIKEANIKNMVKYRTLVHMFDARVPFNDTKKETVEMVKKLIDASFNFQVEKMKKEVKTSKTEQE